jgi:CRP-like cAMP-binding protein
VVTGTRAFVLDLEPDLAADLSDSDLARARLLARGEIHDVAAGPWDPVLDGGQIGLLILAGMVCRELALRDHHLLELLGPGDVLWPGGDRDGLIGGSTVFTAVVDTKVLVLGADFARAAAEWPSLMGRVMGRLEAQRERLAVQALITHVSRAEHRLLLVLWHLAERWGRMTPQGAVLPLALTHHVLGQLAAARRPTATLALAELESAGFVSRIDDGWLVTPRGGRMIETLTRNRASTLPLAHGMMLRQQSIESLRASKAVLAQSRQARSQRDS